MGVDKGGFGYIEQARRLNVEMSEREFVLAMGDGYVSLRSALRAVDQAQEDVRPEIVRQMRIARTSQECSALSEHLSVQKQQPEP